MTNITIKIIVPHFFPEVNALTNRLESFIPRLSLTCDIKIIYLLEPGAEADMVKTQKAFAYSNVQFYPVKADTYNKNGFLGRTIGETRNNIKLWRVAKKIKADSLFVSIPQLMLLPVSGFFLLCESTPRKILEIRDLTWEYLNLGGGFFEIIVKRMFKFLAVFSIKRFDEVVACTEAQAQFVLANTACRVTVVRNGISYDKFKALSLLPEKQKSENVTVAYFGTFGHAQNLMIFVRAAELLLEVKHISFLLAGSGPDTSTIKEYIASKNLVNIQLLDKMPWSQLLVRYSESDILYAQLKPGDGFEKAEPSKLFEFFSTGKHVIYGGTGLGRQLANSFNNVSVIYPDDEVLLAKQIEKLAGSEFSVCEEDQSRIERDFVRENIFDTYIEGANFK
jgi:glycosyltransferase involved in cell wall biosynthesis